LRCQSPAYDWDAVGAADKLGEGQIDLASLEPFQATDYTVSLTDAKTRKQQGTINVRLVFRPQFVVVRNSPSPGISFKR
jgi:Ca2+-dependent lipid-binding protein